MDGDFGFHPDNSGENNPMHGVHLYGENNGMYGKTHTEEIRKEMSNRTTGEKNPKAKLNAEKVLEILELGEIEMPHTKIAEKFGVSLPTINKIFSGEVWSSVTGIPRKFVKRKHNY